MDFIKKREVKATYSRSGSTTARGFQGARPSLYDFADGIRNNATIGANANGIFVGGQALWWRA